MSNARAAHLEAVMAVLRTEFGSEAVMDTRTVPADDALMPWVSVEPSAEAVNTRIHSGGSVRVLAFNVTLVDVSWAEVFDAETRAEAALGGKLIPFTAGPIQPLGTAFQTDRGDRPYYSVSIEYQLTYATPVGDLSEAS